MAFVRRRRRKTGTFYSVVIGRHLKPIPCGKGKEAKEYANDLVAELQRGKRDAIAGIRIRRSSWTVKELEEADLQDATRRGIRTAFQQWQGKRSYREYHWHNLLAAFRPGENVDAISGARIREYIARREADVGPATINRDLDVLRGALAMARDREESGYGGNPFRGIRRLDEKRARRQPRILTNAQLARLVRACWARDERLGAHVELLRLTASRLRQEPEIRGKDLYYPPQKRGTPRKFILEGRLAEIVRLPRRFDRALWRKAVEDSKLGDVRPHDIRHSAMVLEGQRPGASLGRLKDRGGWTDPATAALYLRAEGSAPLRACSGAAAGSKRAAVAVLAAKNGRKSLKRRA